MPGRSGTLGNASDRDGLARDWRAVKLGSPAAARYLFLAAQIRTTAAASERVMPRSHAFEGSFRRSVGAGERVYEHGPGKRQIAADLLAVATADAIARHRTATVASFGPERLGR